MILSTLQQDFKKLQQLQAQNFLNHQSPKQLFQIQTSQTDRIIQNIWQHLKLDQLSLNLFAIGGYGQQELYPYSDLDLLLLHNESTDIPAEKIQQFICMLWDIGFTPKLLTYNLSSCGELARNDLTFYTSLLSLRLLQGDNNIGFRLIKKIYSEEIWSSSNFIKARILQRQQEFEKYNLLIAPVAYNIKLHPGGMRDFHLMRWLLQKIYFSNDWQLLTRKQDIDTEVLTVLKNNLQILQTLRFGLHFSQKNDDNLLSRTIIDVNENKNYLKLFLNKENDNSKFSDQVILQFEKITEENHKLMQQICSYLTRDFSCHP